MLTASSARARGGIAWIRGREESLIQSTSSGSFSDAVNGSPRSSLPARWSARPSQNAMCPSTPATLQYSLTMPPSCRSLKRDTTARTRGRAGRGGAVRGGASVNREGRSDGALPLPLLPFRGVHVVRRRLPDFLVIQDRGHLAACVAAVHAGKVAGLKDDALRRRRFR